MKKKITLALAASIFTLALAANPHTALAVHKLGPPANWRLPTPPPPPPPPTSEAVVMGILGALYSVVFS
jgi:hypothetical protein